MSQLSPENQRRSEVSTNPSNTFHSKIRDAVHSHPNVREHHIDLPWVFNLHKDENGYFVRDLNRVIKWYVGQERLETTELFEEHASVVAQNQHSDTSIEGLINQDSNR